MKQVTYKKPFDIYIPAWRRGNQIGRAKYVKTIWVDCFENFGEDFLTIKANKQIEKERAKAMRANGTLTNYQEFRLSLTYKILNCLYFWMEPKWGFGWLARIVDQIMCCLSHEATERDHKKECTVFYLDKPENME
jgi:hypothetical protein